MKIRNSCTLFGDCIAVIVWAFVGSGPRPLEEMQCPRKMIALVRNSSFSLLRCMRTSLHQCRKALRLSSWALRSSSCTMISSVTQTTPVGPLRACSRCSWNIYDDTLVRKESRSHQYLPNQVWKLVSMLDRSSRVTCQNPWARSALENLVEMVSLWSVSKDEQCALFTTQCFVCLVLLGQYRCEELQVSSL